jgi:molybdopterin-dependent oxidoreductase alpha subunit
MGGNLAVAMSDTHATFAALQKLDLAVHIATKLNRSHLIKAKQLLLLPCLGRTERDVQAGGEQAVTVEDSVSKVHVSRGTLAPASPDLKSECAIVAGIAKATLPDTRVDWDAMVGDYRKIRDAIAAVLPEFADFNQRLMEGGGFHLYNAARHREWKTDSGKANFLVNALPPTALGGDVLQLATIRSHDQYNTTIYGKDDRYRGVTGRRDVLFMNESDLAARGLSHGDAVELETHLTENASGTAYVLRGLTAVAFDIPAGCVAAYYPETNVLIPLSHHDSRSGTPSYKSVPVQVRATSEPSQSA